MKVLKNNVFILSILYKFKTCVHDIIKFNTNDVRMFIQYIY